MGSLSDRIDQLTATAKAIRTSAAAIASSQGDAIPFTRAVLDTALGDLIRDIDASELGLFTLVPPPDADVRRQPDNAARRGEISRVEFHGATPLRKQPAKRDMFRPKDYEPEVYAHAALKYLDRYQSIRQMPRARSQVVAIIERLDETRENIKKLNETLQQLTSAGATAESAAPTSGVADEERRITDLQNRLTELRSQKDSILLSNEPKLAAKAKVAAKQVPKRALSPSPEPENPEDAFWSTPAASARTLRFTDRLLEEEPDFAELSAISFDSPGPPPPKSVFARLAAGSIPSKKDLNTLIEHDVFGEPQVQQGKNEDPGDESHDESSLFEVELEPDDVPDGPDVDIEVNPDEEKTVVLSRAPPSAPADPPPSSEDQLESSTASVEEQSSSLKSTKVRITPELETIVGRIWSTVGEIILPGRGGEKPPRAKETLVLLESLAARSPSPGSPPSSIFSIASATAGGPTSYQVNTAQLLYALLTAPNYAMPLNQLKAAIGGSRALYACVAKKLIRIDRSGREQIVLFDAPVQEHVAHTRRV